MSIAIHLTPPLEDRLTQLARELNVTVEELASAAVRDLVSRPSADFEAAARHVLEKNRELYQRLA